MRPLWGCGGPSSAVAVSGRSFAANAARSALAAGALFSAAVHAVPPTPEELTKLCREAEGTAHCARLVEDRQLQRLPNLARREGSMLKVSLYPSGVSTYADTEALHGGRTYSLWDYLGEINAVILLVTDGDNVMFLLLQRTTGRDSELPSEPKLSPDRSRLVTADFCEERCSNELAVWRVTRDGTRKEVSWKPRRAWSDANATWTSPTSIAIDYAVVGGDTRSRLERRLTDSDWVSAPTR